MRTQLCPPSAMRTWHSIRILTPPPHSSITSKSVRLPHIIVNMGFTRITATFIGAASALALLSLATPQTSRPSSAPRYRSSSGEVFVGPFGNDDTGLDNGVDGTTPWNVEPAGGGNTNPTPDPELEIRGGGNLGCCSEDQGAELTVRPPFQSIRASSPYGKLVLVNPYGDLVLLEGKLPLLGPDIIA
ncbi:hypothetical protein BXZ70DRAFT_960566 [Cristinia sonorae]|uniref:Uncharacterized protein n=1 Tax=Cristinia sonorae TaxID=1940300 RepID=A0A8K0UE18_9AGAR|nr:hypothetical protein BXZ70DRAFT_960566 [Cristinia sonorae]